MGNLFFVTIAAGLSSFGVQKNPAAPSPAEITKYAPTDYDVMVHVDLAAFVPNNYRALRDLPRDPIAKELDIAGKIDTAIRQAEGARTMVKSMTGLDFIEHPTSVTAWAKFADAGQPELLFVVRGAIPADAIEKIGAMSGTAIDVAGRSGIQPEPGIVIAQADSGEIIGGARALVEPRLGKGYKPKGRLDPSLKEVLARKPFAVVVSTPSRSAVRLYSREIDQESLLTDMARGHRFAAVALLQTGVHWSFRATDRDGYERGVAGSEAVVQLIQASQLGARGTAGLLLAALPSYASQPWAQKLIRHQELLEELIDTYVGDTTPRVDFARRAAKNEVSVTVTAKAFSHVVPTVVLGMLAGLGAYSLRASGIASADGAAASPPSGARAAAVPASPGPRSLDLRRAWDRAASQHGGR